MKKSLFTVGAASMMLAVFATGCATTEESNPVQEANQFITAASEYKTHKVQKDNVVNVLLNNSQQLYLNIGAAVVDNIKVRFGEADMMLLMQEYGYAQNYSKDWAAIKLNNDKAKAANENIVKALTKYLKDNQQYQKKNPEQAMNTIKNKLAMEDFVNYKKAAKDKNEETLKSYKGMDAWLALGKKELDSSYGDAFKAAEAKRAKMIEESKKRTEAELEKIQNKSAYIGLYLAVLAAEQGVQKSSGFMRTGAEKVYNSAVAEMKEYETKYPYVKEVLDPILKLKTLEERLAFAKDLASQYGYAISVGAGRLGYTFKALPWYLESKEALDDASGDN